jgi:hypothetical protein
MGRAQRNPSHKTQQGLGRSARIPNEKEDAAEHALKAFELPRRTRNWDLRRLSAQRGSNLGRRHVLSFLVTSFFTRVKKEVTRSSAGGVEALALYVTRAKKELDSRLRGNDEPHGDESYPLAAGGVEALAPYVTRAKKELDSRLRGNDENGQMRERTFAQRTTRRASWQCGE